MAVVVKNPVIVVKGEEDLLPYRISNLGNYSVEDDKATSLKLGAFYYDTNLTNIKCDNVTYIGGNCFYQCSELISIDFPEATTLGSTATATSCFGYCSKLVNVNLPKVTLISASSFYYCSSLINIILLSATAIAYRAFSYCASLQLITLGANQVCTLNATSDLPATSTHHLTIYVPYSLIGSYQTASNWSTLYNNGYITFSPITDTSATITTTVTNGSYSGATSITAPNTTATVTLTANSGYNLPSSITVTNASYTYDSTTGVVSLSNIIGNVTISVTCTAAPSGYTVSISSFTDDGDWTTYYSLDNGSTWNEITGSGNLSNAATQIKFKAVCPYGGSPVYCNITSVTLGLNFSQQGINAGSWETSNYVLSSNVDDIVVDEQGFSPVVALVQ